MLREAGEAVLKKFNQPRELIDLVIHTGVYRTDFLSEPALAAIAAGELRINHDDENLGAHRTFAFDLTNGGAGTLTGCFLAGNLIQAKKFSRALLLASEIENNAEAWPEQQLGLCQTASALLLEDSGTDTGFVSFGFRTFPEDLEAAVSYTVCHGDHVAVLHQRDPALDERYCQCIRATVEDFLREQGISADAIRLVLPSQRSPKFVELLAGALRWPAERFVSLGAGDYFTSSLGYGFARMQQEYQLAAGDLVLLVEVGAGIQVACALYQM